MKTNYIEAPKAPEEDDNELPLFIPTSDKAIFLNKKAKREKAVTNMIKFPRKSILDNTQSITEDDETLSDGKGPTASVSLEDLSAGASPDGSRKDLHVKKKAKSVTKRP